MTAAPKLAKDSAQVAELVLLGAMEALRRSAAAAGGRPDVAQGGFVSAFLQHAPLLRRMISEPAATADSRASFLRLLEGFLEVGAGQFCAALRPAAAPAPVGSCPAAAAAGAAALLDCYTSVLAARRQHQGPDPLPLWVSALGLLRHMLGVPSGQGGPLQSVLAAVTSLVVDTFPATTAGMHRWAAACLPAAALAVAVAAESCLQPFLGCHCCCWHAERRPSSCDVADPSHRRSQGRLHTATAPAGICYCICYCQPAAAASLDNLPQPS